MLKLARFLKPYKAMIAGALLFVFLQTLGDLFLPTLMAKIINDGVMQGDIGRILQIGGSMLLVAAGGVSCAVLASLLSSKTAMNLGKNLRDEVFRRVVGYSLHDFGRMGTATLITRTTNDIHHIQMVTIMMMRMMVSSPLMAAGGLILALQVNRRLTGVLAVALPVLALVVVFIASRVMPLFRLVQVKIDQVNLVLREKLTGIRVIRAFNTVEYEMKRFDEANVALTGNYIKVNRIMAFLMPSIMLVMNATSLAVLWFGGFLISFGQMDLGALAAFTQYTMMIMMSTLMLAMMFIMVPRAQAAAQRINEVLAIVPEMAEIVDLAAGTDNNLSSGLDTDDDGEADNDMWKADGAPALKGHLEFKDVTFAYHGAEKPVLKDITFAAYPGEVTAVIGGTGSGKSTLINLIPRFFDVNCGSILLDGKDIREIPRESLRARIGLVPQKVVLFAGTIAENIRFGREQATEEEVRRAAEIAQATEFIDNIAGGFEHIVSPGGANLSGGQKQRLAIARALVKKPEVYIFDDSFSALDFKTDARLRAALEKEITRATVIIVVQRVTTAMSADRIIVLDEGRVAGKGTHEELFKTCDVYREIVFSQLSEEEIA
ncbi:MAG: ABC transporter ATP-binding protein [Firmicutes bacterium]|nr:ABC transporter ATP-binding protein [Bacillota bacterium]